jgi:N-acetylglucosamine-6-sulfatase
MRFGHIEGSPRRWFVSVVALLAAVLLAAACSASPAPAPPAASEPGSPAPGTAGGPGGRPNIVLVLTDDLSTNLVPYLPQVQALQRAGMSFTNYTVTDSLCCPSRSSIFTGQFPHNTGVFTNTGNDGGFALFHSRGLESATFATGVQRAGYRTAMMGKYLNGYQPADSMGGATPYVPPGWSEWDVAGNGYPEFNYDLNENGRVVHYGGNPSDYLTDVLAGKATAFIHSASAAHTPSCWRSPPSPRTRPTLRPRVTRTRFPGSPPRAARPSTPCRPTRPAG